MKNPIAILILVFMVCSSIQAQVRLEWKIAADKPIYYNAILDVSNTTSFVIGDNDLPEKVISEQAAQHFFDLFDKKPGYVVMKHQTKNIIDVKLSQRIEDSGMDPETIETVKKELGLEENVLLRGSIFSDGGIYTYFIENQQKSLLSAGFELPKKAIAKGDVWQIDFSCIDIEGVFISDTVSRNLRVSAENIEYTQGDTVVTVAYDLSEFIKGRQQLGKHQTKHLGFDVKYLGTGKFSINQGKWLEYGAVFTLESIGVMNGRMKGVFSLRPVDDIPDQYKE